MLERDRREFLGTLRLAERDFVTRQRLFFDGLGPVPLADYRLTARWDRFGDLVRPADAGAYPRAEAVAIPLTEERYRIEGFDTEDAVESMFFTFVKVDGRWFIADDSDLSDIALSSGRHLWDFGPLETRTSEHFLLLARGCDENAGPGLCARLDELLELSEDAMGRVDRLWKLKWHHKVVLLLPSSEAELGRMIQATFDLDNFVAFAVSSVDSERGLDFTGHRVVLNPEAFEERSASSVLSILTHELLHIATRDASGPFVPSFVEEGIADFVGYEGSGSLSFLEGEVAGGSFDARLPQDLEFFTGDATSIFRSYQESQSAVRFFVERWGARALERFYRRLGSRSIAPGTARFHIDAALRDVVGVGFEEFEELWASSLREQ